MQNVLFPTEYSPEIKAELTNTSNTFKMSIYSEYLQSDDINKLKSMVKILVTN
jgi:hypothetical protein